MTDKPRVEADPTEVAGSGGLLAILILLAALGLTLVAIRSTSHRLRGLDQRLPGSLEPELPQPARD